MSHSQTLDEIERNHIMRILELTAWHIRCGRRPDLGSETHDVGITDAKAGDHAAEVIYDISDPLRNAGLLVGQLLHSV